MLRLIKQKLYIYIAIGLASIIAPTILDAKTVSSEQSCPENTCGSCPDQISCNEGCVINVNPLDLANPNKINLVTSCFVRNCPPFPQQFAFANGIPGSNLDVYLNNNLVSPLSGLPYVDTTTNEGLITFIQPGIFTVAVYNHTVTPAPQTRMGPGLYSLAVNVSPGNNLTVVGNVGPTGTAHLLAFQDNFSQPGAGFSIGIVRHTAAVNGNPALTFTLSSSSFTATSSLQYGETASFTVPNPPTDYTLTVKKGATTIASTTQFFTPTQENAYYLVGVYDDSVTPIINTLDIASVTMPANPTDANASIIDVKYDGTEEIIVAQMSDVGPIYGLAWRQQSDDLFASVFYKRFNNLKMGDSLGTIYLLKGVNANPGAPTLITPFIDLDFFFPGEFGTNDNRCINNDFVALAGSTKTGIGAITLTEDGNTLFVMDLFKEGGSNTNYIYAIPTTIGGAVTPYSPGDPRTITKINILANTGILINVYHNAPILLGQSPLNIRPFAIKYHNGRIYVGIVNTSQFNGAGIAPTTTAEALAMQTNLHAYVYSFPNDQAQFNNPDAWVLETHFALNYLRGKPKNLMTPVTGYNFNQGSWFPWTDNENVYFKNMIGVPSTNWPTPILSDIEFIIDQKANKEVMILGLRDRTADQLLDETQLDQQFTANSAGDTLRVDRINDQWIVETDIINGSEFFIGNTTNIHGQTTQGAVVANYSNFNEIVSTALDPLTIYSGGLIMLPMNGPLAGQRRFGITIFASSPVEPSATLGKANGLGALVSLSVVVPYCLEVFQGRTRICDVKDEARIRLLPEIVAQNPSQQSLLAEELYNVDGILLDGTIVNLVSNMPFSTPVDIFIPCSQFASLQALQIYDTKNVNCALVINKSEFCVTSSKSKKTVPEAYLLAKNERAVCKKGVCSR